MLIGYMRVSTSEQNLDLQRDDLERAGCEKIFDDVCSGRATERPGLAKALEIARAGDALVVWKLDRIGRSLAHVVGLVSDLQKQGIGLKVLTGDVDTTTTTGRLFVDSGREMEIVIATQTKDGTTVAAPVVDAVIETIRANKIDVVVIDPFVSSHRVSENDNGAIDRVAKTWGRIADITDCAVELVHHVRKTNGAEISVEDGRGAVALLAATRSARVLNVMSEDEAAKANVENRRLHFRVSDGKASMSPPVEKSDWHKMESVSLGNGHLGGDGDSIGVVTSWAWPDAFDGIEAADLLKAQKAIEGAQWRENDQAGDWVGRPIARALDIDIGTGRTSDLTKAQKAAKAKVKTLIRVWIGTGALVLVEGQDAKRNARKFVEVGEWAVTETFR